MVREVEFVNESEIVHPTLEYTNHPDQPMFEGYLTNGGKTLNVKVHIPLEDDSISQRILFLYFGNIDFDNKVVEYIKLSEVGPDFKIYGEDTTDIVYSFDLSRVLIIPRKIYSTGGTSEITVELYTYESNITTDYGSKTLSVPYTVNNDSKYAYEKSTDGVYRLAMVDFELWVNNRTYGLGDIVVLENGSIVMSIIANNTLDPLNPEGWSAPSDDDLFYFARGMTKYPPSRACLSDMMVSRYAKYSIIKDVVLATSFKAHDDASSYELALLLQNIREKAKFKLMLHKPIDAAYCLQNLKVASSVKTDTTKINTYNITYTSQL